MFHPKRTIGSSSELSHEKIPSKKVNFSHIVSERSKCTNVSDFDDEIKCVFTGWHVGHDDNGISSTFNP